MIAYSLDKIGFFSKAWCDGADVWTRTPERMDRIKFEKVNPTTGVKSEFAVPKSWVDEFDLYVKDLGPDDLKQFLRVYGDQPHTGGRSVEEISEIVRNSPLKRMSRGDFVRLLGYDPQGDGWTRLPDADGKAVYQLRRKPAKGNTLVDVACECREGTRSKLDAEGYRVYTFSVPMSYVDYYTREFNGLPRTEFMERVKRFF